MTTAPSIDAVSGLVEELRALSAYPGDAYDRAADALEAQARGLASLRDHHQEALSRIAALEDAVRAKDEALRPFAAIADLVSDKSGVPDRTALSNGEPHDQ